MTANELLAKARIYLNEQRETISWLYVGDDTWSTRSDRAQYTYELEIKEDFFDLLNEIANGTYDL